MVGQAGQVEELKKISDKGHQIQKELFSQSYGSAPVRMSATMNAKAQALLAFVAFMSLPRSGDAAPLPDSTPAGANDLTDTASGNLVGAGAAQSASHNVMTHVQREPDSTLPSPPVGTAERSSSLRHTRSATKVAEKRDDVIDVDAAERIAMRRGMAADKVKYFKGELERIKGKQSNLPPLRKFDLRKVIEEYALKMTGRTLENLKKPIAKVSYAERQRLLISGRRDVPQTSDLDKISKAARIGEDFSADEHPEMKKTMRDLGGAVIGKTVTIRDKDGRPVELKPFEHVENKIWNHNEEMLKVASDHAEVAVWKQAALRGEFPSQSAIESGKKNILKEYTFMPMHEKNQEALLDRISPIPGVGPGLAVRHAANGNFDDAARNLPITSKAMAVGDAVEHANNGKWDNAVLSILREVDKIGPILKGLGVKADDDFNGGNPDLGEGTTQASKHTEHSGANTNTTPAGLPNHEETVNVGNHHTHVHFPKYHVERLREHQHNPVKSMSKSSRRLIKPPPL